MLSQLKKKPYLFNFFQLIREDQETFDNLGNHNAHGNSECTNLESEHSDETSHQAVYKAEPEQCKDPGLQRVAMSSSSSQGQLRQVSNCSLKNEAHSLRKCLLVKDIDATPLCEIKLENINLESNLTK